MKTTTIKKTLRVVANMFSLYYWNLDQVKPLIAIQWKGLLERSSRVGAQ
jgi:hypothetical protein